MIIFFLLYQLNPGNDNYASVTFLDEATCREMLLTLIIGAAEQQHEASVAGSSEWFRVFRLMFLILNAQRET